MTLLDTTEWKEFPIGVLFQIEKGTRLTKANMIAGSTPFIGASALNNGITSHIANPEHIHPAGTITITYNGSVGEAFYQDKPFWASDDVNVLYPKFQLNRYIALFIIPILKKVGQRYAFIDKWKKEDMERDTIKLPVDLDGNPNFLYMETYTKNLEGSVDSFLSELQSANSSSMKKKDSSQWGPFLVRKMFDIHPTKAYKLTNAALFEEGGSIPVVVNSSFNNGIGGYTHKPPTEAGGIITFSDTTTATAIFYQDRPFVGYPHVQGMYPIGKYQKRWTQHSLLFFLSVFRRSAFNRRFDYVNKFTRELAGEIVVQLPISQTGDPDFPFMEKYIENLELKNAVILSALKDCIM